MLRAGSIIGQQCLATRLFGDAAYENIVCFKTASIDANVGFSRPAVLDLVTNQPKVTRFAHF